MPVANTFITDDATVNREELSDVVSRITPEDTPIWTMSAKGVSTSINPNWATDALDDPGDNFVPEGETFTFDVVTPAVRLANFQQIMSKTFIISKTQDAVDNAGQTEKTKENMLKKGRELRKDIEYMIVSNEASVGTGTRRSGGLPSWIETNVSRGVGGLNGGFDQGTGLTVAATDGTPRAFAKDDLDQVMQDAFTSGGNVRFGYVSPFVKTTFATFMSDTNVAQFRYQTASSGQRTIVANAEIYESAHGEVAIVANRVMAQDAGVARNVFLIDPDVIAVPALRPIHNVQDVAITSDATPGVVLTETHLMMKNEKACGIIADVFGLTATT